MKQNNFSPSVLWAMVFLVSGFGFMAQADTTLEFSSDEGSRHIYLTPRGVRMDISGKDGKPGSIIFDSDKNQYMVLAHEDKEYVVMTEKDIQAIGQMREQMMQKLEAQLAQMPPAQREQMRQMMIQRMGGGMGGEDADKPVIRYVDSGRKEQVMGHHCAIYELRMNQRHEGEVCLAPIDELGIAPEDYASFARMMDLMHKIVKAAGVSSDGMMAGMPKNMAPVRYESNGTEVTLKAIHTKSLDPALFAPPAGYQRHSLDIQKLPR